MNKHRRYKLTPEQIAKLIKPNLLDVLDQQEEQKLAAANKQPPAASKESNGEKG